MSQTESLIDDLLAGEHRALARVITKIENRSPGYRELVSQLHQHTGHADVIGITGSPGAGKSTLVDKVTEIYRDEGLTVGIIAIDPASPFTGGAVLGDRIRMASNRGDMDVFFRSMSARGALGGLSTATTDAVKALDAFGKDKIIVETVGAGQNEIDIVKTADTVAVLVPPSSGDDIQMMKAGILEIADVFVVNKADLDGADRMVQELREMVHMSDASPLTPRTATDLDTSEHHGEPGGSHGEPGGSHGDSGGSHGETGGPHGDDGSPHGGSDGETEGGDGGGDDAEEHVPEEWEPTILETVAKSGEGVDEFMAALANHREYLVRTGRLKEKARTRYAEEIQTLLREDTGEILERELAERGGLDQYVDAVLDRETDPYEVADEIVGPLEDCVEERRE